MNCQFIQKNVADIVENRLSPGEASEVKAHLATCDRCANLVTRFAQEWQALEEQQRIQSSPAFWFKLQQRINTTEAQKVRVASLVPGGLHRLQTAATVATLVACVLAGSYAGRFAARRGAVAYGPQASYKTEQVFQYYLGGLDDSPRGSVGEFYTNPGEAVDTATGDDGATGSGGSARVTPQGNG
ncbi:MAG: zf-HC2 domain-containing protein [Candidatus Eisenbacteria bacterium]|nr:zf-HC2 domain-containing protein [Candidatus Eisenbacteria bacterium]